MFAAALFVVFLVVTDLLRDPDLGGWAKALWIICLVFLPFPTTVVYIIARGKGMAQRTRSLAATREGDVACIRQFALTSPSAEISTAKSLLDSGVITAAEFQTLKARALSSTTPTREGAHPVAGGGTEHERSPA